MNIIHLRDYVGHAPLLSCVAGVIILDDRKRVLLQRRGDDNCWCIPGGGMELGESVEETAKREVWEETGLRIDEMQLFNVYSGPQQHHIYPNGDEVYFVNVVFVSNQYHGDLTVDHVETLELAFFDLDHLPDTLSLTNIPVMQDLRRRFQEFV